MLSITSGRTLDVHRHSGGVEEWSIRRERSIGRGSVSTDRPYLPLASAFADSSSPSISSGQQPSSPSSAATANHNNQTDDIVDSLTNHVSTLSTTDDSNAQHWNAESMFDSTANAGFTGHVRTSIGRIHTHTTLNLPIFKYFFPLYFILRTFESKEYFIFWSPAPSPNCDDSQQ